ncbi:MAG: peptidoglycan-binding protein [Anaerosomatales bacterium]|nr:peptidoglycan-binding protein [Anaerosomatales bacterium]
MGLESAMTLRIERGARGPAVEDVQKRLAKLGYDLGPSGVDGVFLGATLEALRAFQREHGLVDDGVVGPKTWAALVDATFSLGDRILYLRYPFLHGADVAALQTALNVLGFPCGEIDGIFGPSTEQAVREFQFNVGLPADGVAGDETLRAIQRLRHAWQGRDPAVPTELRRASVAAASAMTGRAVRFEWRDRSLRAVCERAANLVQAITEGARATAAEPEDPDEGFDAIVALATAAGDDKGLPVARLDLSDAPRSASRLTMALASVSHRPARVIALVDEPRNEEEMQRLAVLVVDALAAAFGRADRPVV